MKEKKVMKLASRGKRFGAACIDTVMPALSVFIFFIALIIAAVSRYSFNNGFGYGFGSPDFGYGYGYSQGPSGGTIAALIIAFLLGVAYVVIQLIFFNKSTTMGKAALGLQVISSKDGEPVGFWKMLFREWFVKGASGSVFLLGYIWILIDDRNRGWHDKILDTYVVDLRESAALSAASTPKPVHREASANRPAPKSAPLPLAPAPQPAEPAAAVSDDFDNVYASTAENTDEKKADAGVMTEAEAVIELPGTITEEDNNNENEQE